MQKPPKTIPLSEILPDEPMLLMGAGPVPIPYAVARANGVVINHLGETMNQVVRRVKEMSQYIFQTKSDHILGVAGPASAAMEMAIGNLVWPGRKVLTLKNGTFSDRFGLMAQRVGAEVTEISPTQEIGPISADQVREAFKKEKFDVVTMVQGETSCGVENVELPQIVKIAKENGALVIVDAVCTLTTMPLKMDQWGIDAVMVGGQKGLSSIPGVSLIAFSEEAWQVIKNRKEPRPHWCLDALLADEFWSGGGYHYTAPVPGVLAVFEALRLICQETLEKRFIRHKKSSVALQNAIEKMGIELFVPKEHRLNSVVSIDLPQGVDSVRLRDFMADHFHVEISGAFGLNIVRIGQMGEQCRSQNLFKTVHALGLAFRNEGVNVDLSAGMAALEEELAPEEGEFVR